MTESEAKKEEVKNPPKVRLIFYFTVTREGEGERGYGIGDRDSG